MKYLSKQTTYWATEKISTNLEVLNLNYSRIILEISNSKVTKNKISHGRTRLVVCAYNWVAEKRNIRKHSSHLQTITDLLLYPITYITVLFKNCNTDITINNETM